MELKVGFEPTRAKPTAYKTVPIDHYGTSAYVAKAQPFAVEEFLLEFPSLSAHNYYELGG